MLQVGKRPESLQAPFNNPSYVILTSNKDAGAAAQRQLPLTTQGMVMEMC